MNGRLTCSGHGPCQLYGPGHNTHWIHAKQVGRTPWGWRDGVVARIDRRWLTVEYVAEPGRLRLWHHTSMRPEIDVGALVRVHEGYSVLGGPFGWLNVLVEGGLGAVPEPVEPAMWDGMITGGVQDLSTGRALALDHVSPDARL